MTEEEQKRYFMIASLLALFGGILLAVLCLLCVYCMKEYRRRKRDESLVNQRLRFRYNY